MIGYLKAIFPAAMDFLLKSTNRMNSLEKIFRIISNQYFDFLCFMPKRLKKVDQKEVLI